MCVPVDVLAILQEIHAQYSGLDQGKAPTYILELSHTDPALFGIAVMDVADEEYIAGNVEIPFTIQPVSMPLVFALADRLRIG